MKKTLVTLCAVSAPFLTNIAFAADAGTPAIIGSYDGIEYNFWRQNYQVNGARDGDESGYMASFVYTPKIVIIPNMRAATTEINGNTLNYDKQDLSLYYNIINTDYGLLSLGGGWSQALGHSYLSGQKKSLDKIKGHVFGAVEIGSAVTGILFAQGIFSEGQYDYKVGWKYPFKADSIELDLQAGYRAFEIDFADFGGLNNAVKSSVDGFFIGASLYLL
ncbi:hypothetical protein F9817_13745 [Vibrio sp. CAIM 722]|uniref:Outer membrane protein n=1 Tax=Vibrio eleionomae TaxID=2653505 RepID=A0A7X4LMA1_9VIBR|nr:hypothetical protein [Vibrio eleionomae]MZI94257.1 hypothetical protein [Vibrio eleionomae]